MLFWLLVIGLIIWLLVRNRGQSSSSRSDSGMQLEQRNYEWAQFIAGYKNKVRTKSDKALIDRMLSDIEAQGLPVPKESQAYGYPVDQSSSQEVATAAQLVPQVATYAHVESADQRSEEAFLPGPMLVQERPAPIDSAVLLLYFGAFLFLGAVGLFLAFGNLPGVAKSVLVGLLVVLFYVVGQWLYQRSKRLKQGGLAFIGIGLILLPFFGLSLHVDALQETNGPLVWGITSLLAVALYYHALVTTKQAFITYSMLAAVLSLFESGVSIVSLPTYYFALGMAAVSILFLVLSRRKNNMKELEEPLIVSANALIPISLVMSLFYIPAQGLLQASLALLLASAFYGVYAWLSLGDKRSQLAIIADCFLLAGVSVMIYSQTKSIEVLAPSLCILAALQLLALALTRRARNIPPKLFRWLMMVTASLPLIACVFAQGNAALLAATLFAAAAFMVSIHTLTRDPGYIALACFLLFLWVLEMGWYWQADLWSATDFVIAWFGLAILFFGQRLRHMATSPLGSIYRVSYLSALVLAVFSSFFGGWRVATSVAVLTSVVAYLLSRYESSRAHALILCMIVLHYIAALAGSFGIRNFEQSQALSLMLSGIAIVHYGLGYFLRRTTGSDLYFNSGLAGTLIGTICVVLGPANTWPMLLGLSIFAVVALLEHRRLASSNMLSLSLIAQYGVAAWGASLIARDLQMLTTPFLFMVLALTQYAISRFANDQASRSLWSSFCLIGLALGAASVAVYGRTTIPMVANLVLLICISFSEARRLKSQGIMALSIVSQYLLTLWLVLLQDYLPGNLLLPSSIGLLAVAHYYFNSVVPLPDYEKDIWAKSGLVGTALGAFLVVVYGETTLPMILSLASLGCIAYIESHKQERQAGKEWALAIVMAAFQWWLYFLGVRELLIYTHLWAALLASFALWRNSLADLANEKSFTYAALGTLSLPLLMKALDAPGEVYGWLLIIEHVILMILGISVHRRYIMWWGLGVATVAVLYQLRDLPFAGLGFLSVVVIGVALYILGRQKDEK